MKLWTMFIKLYEKFTQFGYTFHKTIPFIEIVKKFLSDAKLSKDNRIN